MTKNEFRMWCKISKKMYLPADCEDFNIRLLKKDETFIWMQYTGLNDKNGNKIFEGDIIEWHRPFNYPNGKFKIVFDEGRFGFYDNFSLCFNSLHEIIIDKNVVDCIIIGNIYETPELL